MRGRLRLEPRPAQARHRDEPVQQDDRRAPRQRRPERRRADDRATEHGTEQHRGAGVEGAVLAEGAAVQHNQGILVMEAMKMQNEIKAPKAGVVKRLNVGEGAAVNAGDLLATVE